MKKNLDYKLLVNGKETFYGADEAVAMKEYEQCVESGLFDSVELVRVTTLQHRMKFAEKKVVHHGTRGRVRDTKKKGKVDGKKA